MTNCKNYGDETMIEKIKKCYPRAIKKKCCEQGCRLDLAGIGKHVVLKGELLVPKNHPTKPKICDCLVFSLDDRFRISVVELKSISNNWERVKEQLTGGREHAYKILKNIKPNRTPEIVMVWLTKRRTSSTVEFFKKSVCISNEKYYIQYVNCGSSLKSIHGSYSPSYNS